MMLAWMVGLGAKYLFQRARPVLEDPVSTSPGYSFPSGHALNSAAWATIVVFSSGRCSGRRRHESSPSRRRSRW